MRHRAPARRRGTISARRFLPFRGAGVGSVWGLVATLGLAIQSTSAADPAPGITPAPQYLGVSAGLPIRKPVRTFKDLKERRVVRQRYDFSCGAAALATILREYYDLPVAEEGIVAYIIHKRGEAETVRRYKEKKGFSLLDLKLAAASIKFRASAYSEMGLGELVGLNAPVIVPIRTREYDHFVVFRGIEGDRVYLTDPVVGNLTMKAKVFLGVWRDGVGMVLKSPQGFVPRGWRPDKDTQGFYVAQDQVRALIQSRGAGGFVRGEREF